MAVATAADAARQDDEAAGMMTKDNSAAVAEFWLSLYRFAPTSAREFTRSVDYAAEMYIREREACDVRQLFPNNSPLSSA